MPSLRITKKAVDAVPIPGSADAFYWDNDRDGPAGFGLRVTPKGVRSYVFQFRVKGLSARRMTIGKHGPWTPERARERAKELAREVDRGIDPVLAGRETQRRAVTLEFGGYLDTFTEGYLKTEWGPSWPQARRQIEMHVLPHLKGTALPAITKTDINSIFDKLTGKPALGRNVWAALSKMLNWAVRRGDIEVSPMSSMDPPAGARARKRVLSDDELLALWRSCSNVTAPFGSFVRLLLITLQRRSEVAELSWVELSKDDALWRLPGQRAKNKLDHLVPLSRSAIEELDALGWKKRGPVFTTTGATPISGFSKMKQRLDGLMLAELQKVADERAERAGEDAHKVFLEPWRLHDLRRTGTTNMQRLGVSIEVTERVINHHQGGEAAGIRGIYNLYEYQPEKACALQAWADWLSTLVTGHKPAGNVVPIATARS